MEATKERGAIVREGAGGFLNPPGHPEHKLSVETDLKRAKHNRGSMSLRAAAECDWLDDNTRRRAQDELNRWEPLPLDSDEIQDWIAQVLGYFRNCYRGEGDEPECWNAGNLRILNPDEEALPYDLHAGVRLIRRYYPDFQPSPNDFERAYWGKKPEAV